MNGVYIACVSREWMCVYPFHTYVENECGYSFHVSLGNEYDRICEFNSCIATLGEWMWIFVSCVSREWLCIYTTCVSRKWICIIISGVSRKCMCVPLALGHRLGREERWGKKIKERRSQCLRDTLSTHPSLQPWSHKETVLTSNCFWWEGGNVCDTCQWHGYRSSVHSRNGGAAARGFSPAATARHTKFEIPVGGCFFRFWTFLK